MPPIDIGIRKPETAEDFASLSELLKNNQLESLSGIAKQLIDNFPNDSIGWKIIGAIYRKNGDLARGYAAMFEALKIAPNDAEIHYNLGILADDLGELTQAETNYRKAIALNPQLLVAYNNLGVVLHKLRRYEDAEAIFRTALKKNPKHLEIHNNRSATLKALSRLDEAEESCRIAIEIDDQYSDAYCNLGDIYKEKGKVAEAESQYRNALKLNPADAGTFNNLGNLLVDIGRLAEAEECFQCAVRHDPKLGDAWNNLGNLLSYGPNLDNEILAYFQALEVDPQDAGLVAAVFLAVRHYINGADYAYKKFLKTASPIAQKIGAKYTAAKAYYAYLNKLSMWHEVHRINSCDVQYDDKRLFVVGDSHTLGFQGLDLALPKQRLKCSLEWIPGCKQWHLGCENANKYKRKFELILGKIPLKSTVLLMIGEIDCRLNEGILIARQKFGECPISSIAERTVDSYLDYVFAVAAKYDHQIIIAGVQAPNYAVGQKVAGEFTDLVEVIRAVNGRLKQRLSTRGVAFLDLFALTDRGDGAAKVDVHLDDFHLVPDIYVEALRFVGVNLDS
jgi:tetratricopeptide (TPR) repeat protein